MIEKIKFKEKEVDSIINLLNNTYGYDFNYDGESSFDEKIGELNSFYKSEKLHVINTNDGIAEISLPSEWNGTLFISDILVNMKVKSMGEIFGVEKFKLTKMKKEELGLIIIENHLEDSIPTFVIVD